MIFSREFSEEKNCTLPVLVSHNLFLFSLSVIVGDAMIGIISLQDFDGSWPMSEQLINLLKIPENITTPPEGIVSN